MHLLYNILAVATFTLILCIKSASTQPFQWEISRLETHSSSLRQGHNHNMTIQFHISSPPLATGPTPSTSSSSSSSVALPSASASASTICTLSVPSSINTTTPTTYPPFPQLCTNQLFAFSLASFTSISSFSLQVQQSLDNPSENGAAPFPETFFGTTALISPATVSGYRCLPRRGAARECHLTGVLTVNVTSAIG